MSLILILFYEKTLIFHSKNLIIRSYSRKDTVNEKKITTRVDLQMGRT